MKDTKSEEEDSEEEYEEGEFDAVGGGPTRWIRGALIGMGSFGSVYLGMNRTSRTHRLSNKSNCHLMKYKENNENKVC